MRLYDGASDERLALVVLGFTAVNLNLEVTFIFHFCHNLHKGVPERITAGDELVAVLVNKDILCVVLVVRLLVVYIQHSIEVGGNHQGGIGVAGGFVQRDSVGGVLNKNTLTSGQLLGALADCFSFCFSCWLVLLVSLRWSQWELPLRSPHPRACGSWGRGQCP